MSPFFFPEYILVHDTETWAYIIIEYVCFVCLCEFFVEKAKWWSFPGFAEWGK